MNAFRAPTRALVAAFLGLLLSGLSHADNTAKPSLQKEAVKAAPAAASATGGVIKDLSKDLSEKKGATSITGEDRQYPGVKPRPPVPPRKPGDLNEKLGNKAVSP